MQNLKITLIALALASCFGAVSAQPSSTRETVSVIGHERGYVQSVEPLFRSYTERKEVCRDEQVTDRSGYSSDSNPAGVVIGAIAGGILGNQVGGGSGKALATGLGLVTGAIVGDNLSRRDARTPTSRTTRVCRDEAVQVRAPAGFEVTFTYQERNYTLVTETDPGQYVQLVVGVSDVQPTSRADRGRSYFNQPAR